MQNRCILCCKNYVDKFFQTFAKSNSCMCDCGTICGFINYFIVFIIFCCCYPFHFMHIIYVIYCLFLISFIILFNSLFIILFLFYNYCDN